MIHDTGPLPAHILRSALNAFQAAGCLTWPRTVLYRKISIEIEDGLTAFLGRRQWSYLPQAGLLRLDQISEITTNPVAGNGTMVVYTLA